MSFSKLKVGQALDQIDIDFLIDIFKDDYTEISELPISLDYRITMDWRETKDDRTD